jgi:G:T-mismatch repair DNA endonuclease (very short patch repair protein)
MLCDYGCNQEGRYQLKNGKWCCCKSPTQCPITKNKIRSKIKLLHDDENSIYNKNKEKIRIKQSNSQVLAWKKDTHKCKTQEVKKRQRDINLKNRKLGIYDTKEYRKKLSASHKKIWKNPNSSYNSEERSIKISRSMKKLYTDEGYLKKLQKGLKTKPNKPEQFIIKILRVVNKNNFKFVGNFTKWIGGRNPDFLDKNNNKIIELFGDYWHSKELTGLSKLEHENERKKHFKKYGYDTLIIWEHELKNKNKIINKINEFLEE